MKAIDNFELLQLWANAHKGDAEAESAILSALRGECEHWFTDGKCELCGEAQGMTVAVREPTALDKMFASFRLDTCQPGIDPLLGCELTDEIKQGALEELMWLRIWLVEATTLVERIRWTGDGTCSDCGESMSSGFHDPTCDLDAFLSAAERRKAGGKQQP